VGLKIKFTVILVRLFAKVGDDAQDVELTGEGGRHQAGRDLLVMFPISLIHPPDPGFHRQWEANSPY
jgi:hypothetical protein